VIALYLEGLRNPDRFRAATQRAAEQGKRIVAFKVGRSVAGARAAISHTGALAGADRIYDAFFQQLGVIRAQSFADLIDIPAALAHRRALTGRRLAIVTTTGGAATLLASASYDAVVVVVGSSAIGQPDLVAKPLIAAMSSSSKPLLAYVSPDSPHIVRHLNRHGVPAFAAPESVTAALSAMAQTPPRASAVQARRPIDDLALPAGPLNEVESKQLFARFGIPAVREHVAKTPAQAQAAALQLGGKLVAKVVSRQIAHKTEIG